MAPWLPHPSTPPPMLQPTHALQLLAVFVCAAAVLLLIPTAAAPGGVLVLLVGGWGGVLAGGPLVAPPLHPPSHAPTHPCTAAAGCVCVGCGWAGMHALLGWGSGAVGSCWVSCH